MYKIRGKIQVQNDRILENRNIIEFRGKRHQNTCIAQNEEFLKLCLILNLNHKQYHHVQSNIIIKFCERLRGLLTVINNLISDATYLSLFSFFFPISAMWRCQNYIFMLDDIFLFGYIVLIEIYIMFF